MAASGQELPYASEKISGFSIARGQAKISIPIKQKRVGEEYVTIASTSFTLSEDYGREMPADIRFSLKRNNIMDFELWIGGVSLGSMAIDLGDGNAGLAKPVKPLPAGGAKLAVDTVMSNMRYLFRKLVCADSEFRRVEIRRQLREFRDRIEKCGNREDFAEPVLELLTSRSSQVVALLMPMVRKIYPYWSDYLQRELAEFCLSYLSPGISGRGFSSSFSYNSINETIMTAGRCCTADECWQLARLTQLTQVSTRHRSALLQAFAYAGIMQSWIFEQLKNDFRSDWGTRKNKMQHSLRCLGLSIYNGHGSYGNLDLGRVIQTCQDVMTDKGANKHPLAVCANRRNAMVTLGYLCTRKPLMVSVAEVQAVLEFLQSPTAKKIAAIHASAERTRNLVLQLIQKGSLEEEEEQYLLGLLTEEE